MIQRTGSQTPRPAAPASFYSKRFPIAKSQTSCGRLRYSIRGMFDQKNIPFGVLLRKHKQCANSERSSFKERHTASELSGDCKLYVQYWCLSKSVLLIIVSHLSVRMQSHRQPFAEALSGRELGKSFFSQNPNHQLCSECCSPVTFKLTSTMCPAHSSLAALFSSFRYNFCCNFL